MSSFSEHGISVGFSWEWKRINEQLPGNNSDKAKVERNGGKDRCSEVARLVDVITKKKNKKKQSKGLFLKLQFIKKKKKKRLMLCRSGLYIYISQLKPPKRGKNLDAAPTCPLPWRSGAMLPCSICSLPIPLILFLIIYVFS